MIWYRWELKRALRSRSIIVSAGLLCLFVAASYMYGQTQIQRQLEVLAKLKELTAESDLVYFQERFQEDETVGRACYYLSTPTAHEPLPEAALSLGQRDLHSYHQVVRLRTLYAHLFDSGFSNPSQAAAGHFDLAFVLVFLLPLIVIAVTFDVLSADGERRTLPLLRAGDLGLGSLVGGRLAVRFGLLGSLSAVLVLASLAGCHAATEAYLPWVIATLSYLLFWFGLVGLVCSRGWNSARNAGALLGIWTVLTILGPALLNLTSPREATKNGASITIRARQVVNDGWDLDKEKTARAAEEADPRYKMAPVVQENFSWSWYFAMHDAGDAAVEEMADSYFNGLLENYQRSFDYSILFPPVRLQLLFDEFSATDLLTHLEYYRFVKQSRENMRDDFLPRVFAEETLSKKELLRLHDDISLQVFRPKQNLWSSGLWELLGVSLFMVCWALFSLRRVEKALRG
jgi:ABC-2 type transport system permease protein